VGEGTPIQQAHYYATIDTYETYEVYMHILNFERGQETLEAFKQSQVGQGKPGVT
jgi:hypothetical protein